MNDAMIQCALSPKKYARVVLKVIKSAAGNATADHDLERDRLVIAEAVVGKGTFVKRISLHGRGRQGTITKKRSHVRITVMESDEMPRKRVKVNELEAPWKKHRRTALLKQKLAKEAGLA